MEGAPSRIFARVSVKPEATSLRLSMRVARLSMLVSISLCMGKTVNCAGSFEFEMGALCCSAGKAAPGPTLGIPCATCSEDIAPCTGLVGNLNGAGSCSTAVLDTSLVHRTAPRGDESLHIIIATSRRVGAASLNESSLATGTSQTSLADGGCSLPCFKCNLVPRNPDPFEAVLRYLVTTDDSS